MNQKTIQKSVSITGIGLHSGLTTTLQIHPAKVDTGIVFIRTDKNERPAIPVSFRNLHHRMRCTALVYQEAEVHTTEHLLATCLALQLDNLTIEISGPEVPGLDGSALPFYRLLQEAGVQDQKEKAREIVIQEALEVKEKEAYVRIEPFSPGLSLSYHLDYGLKYLPSQKVSFLIDEESFAREIAPARTFALKEEVEALRKMGLGKGANLQNTLVLDPAGHILENTLRFPDEFARHKLLDLLGDIALVGSRLTGKIEAYRAGHTLNAALVSKIMEKYDHEK